MKTTIDIPEPLYKRAKIRAVQKGLTLRQVVLASLRRELEAGSSGGRGSQSLWQRRQLLPEYAEAAKAGAYRVAPETRDITELISEDRDAR